MGNNDDKWKTEWDHVGQSGNKEAMQHILNKLREIGNAEDVPPDDIVESIDIRINTNKNPKNETDSV